MRASLKCIIALVMTLAIGSAMAAPLSGSSKGHDYVEATPAERLSWATLVSSRVRSTRTVEDLAIGIVKCLDEALTARKREERTSVAITKSQPLADLSAMCALMIANP